MSSKGLRRSEPFVSYEQLKDLANKKRKKMMKRVTKRIKCNNTSDNSTNDDSKM